MLLQRSDTGSQLQTSSFRKTSFKSSAASSSRLYVEIWVTGGIQFKRRRHSNLSTYIAPICEFYNYATDLVRSKLDNMSGNLCWPICFTLAKTVHSKCQQPPWSSPPCCPCHPPTHMSINKASGVSRKRTFNGHHSAPLLHSCCMWVR